MDTTEVEKAMREAFKLPVSVKMIPQFKSRVNYHKIADILEGKVNPDE